MPAIENVITHKIASFAVWIAPSLVKMYLCAHLLPISTCLRDRIFSLPKAEGTYENISAGDKF